ncbi:E1-E2 ATPase family protein [Mycobacterium ulcerans str. Harvey]|uniref:E1-E2 ATPase family protein n=1 Tax=Mycobacterium ulcerans str. Harvey TaxID=1299332 RepID=A0ABN0RAV8_MYCUL|nr:E1-E2 ATPase family protein [Mycobacterium ulcerans str. Harvey]
MIDGTAAIDMSAMTGESKPVRALRTRPSSAAPSSWTASGHRGHRGGADTQFAAMVRLVEEAQAQKARAQRLADRISAVFVPVVFAIAGVAGVAWLLSGAGADRPSR